MRNMSFTLTIPQFKARTKTVTRRVGWATLKPGDRIMACEKCQGLGKGGKIVRLGEIEIVHVLREQLNAITQDECVLEGFPDMTPADFISMFVRANYDFCPTRLITRIEYRYI